MKNHGGIRICERMLFRNWASNLRVAGYESPEIIPIKGSAARVMNAVWAALELGMLMYSNPNTGRIGKWFFSKNIAMDIINRQKSRSDQT